MLDGTFSGSARFTNELIQESLLLIAPASSEGSDNHRDTHSHSREIASHIKNTHTQEYSAQAVDMAPWL